MSLDWGRLKDLLQSMEAKLEDKATKESMNAMVSQIMSRANEVAQVREELLQKVLEADQRVGEATAETAAAMSRLGTFEERLRLLAASEERINEVEESICGHHLGAEDLGRSEEEASADAVAEAAAVASGTHAYRPDDRTMTKHEKIKKMNGVQLMVQARLQPLDKRQLLLQEQLDALQEQLANTALEMSHLSSARPRSPGGVSDGGASAAQAKMLEGRLEEMERRMVGMEEQATVGAEKNKALEDQVRVLSMELAVRPQPLRPIALLRRLGFASSDLLVLGWYGAGAEGAAGAGGAVLRPVGARRRHRHGPVAAAAGGAHGQGER